MKTNSPLISIITVLFNGEEYLEHATQNIANQIYTNIEYIIIDGGSTDKTIDIIKKYEENIDFFISELDKGIYDAMNKGIKKAKGKYIGLLNSDDYYEPDAIEIITNKINTQPDFDFFFGNANIINEYIQKKKLQKSVNHKNIKKDFSIIHPTVFVKKETYTKYGLFDISYKIAADYELLLRFYKKNCKFLYINKTITNFRDGGMSYYNKGSAQEQFRIHKEHTTLWNAYFAKTKLKIKELLQKIFKKLLGERKYHNLRYKYLYK